MLDILKAEVCKSTIIRHAWQTWWMPHFRALPAQLPSYLLCGVRREDVEGWQHIEGPQLDAPGLQVPQVRPLGWHQEEHSLPDLAHARCAPHSVHIPVQDTKLIHTFSALGA